MCSNILSSIEELNILPNHVAIIMDGNRRWGKINGAKNDASEAAKIGHIQGYASLKKLMSLMGTSLKNHIKFITVFAFSSENWTRSSEEVNAIFNLLIDVLKSNDYMQHDIRLLILGDKLTLPQKLKEAMIIAETKTAKFQGPTFVLAFNYSGIWDITEGFKNFAKADNKNLLDNNKINSDFVKNFLPSAFLPPVDLLIRTGGEKRLSNFLLWQIAYSEIYFTDILWPDFGVHEFIAALKYFQSKDRRYGGNSNTML